MRRRRNNKNTLTAFLIIFALGSIITFFTKYWKIALIILSVLATITIIAIIIYFVIKKKKAKTITPPTPIQQPTTKKYTIKQQYVSNCEKNYFTALKNIIGDKFIIYPQVPLSQIIVKTTEGYANELFRIIDFCIFNYEMKPLVCIEINDNTHNQFKRIQRDKKVNEILSAAGLPLITLWTSYGIQPDYIRKRLQDYINV